MTMKRTGTKDQQAAFRSLIRLTIVAVVLATTTVSTPIRAIGVSDGVPALDLHDTLEIERLLQESHIESRLVQFNKTPNKGERLGLLEL